MIVHDNFSDLDLSNYDFIILDIWGVIHSSGILFDGVLERLLLLQSQKKNVILVSNAPRRAKKVEGFLQEKMGLTKGIHYNYIMTSGESFVLESEDSTPKVALYIGEKKDIDLFTDLSKIKITENETDPFDIIVVTGVTTNTDYIGLSKFVKLCKPLYCINPDVFIVKSDGALEHCAGFLAQQYKEIGGDVIYFGKPYSTIYKQVFKLIPNISKERVIAVGDGMETDILGANNFGITSALCLAGLPSHEIGQGNTSLEDFLSQFPFKPAFIIKNL